MGKKANNKRLSSQRDANEATISSYFLPRLGAERWGNLKEALKSPPKHVALIPSNRINSSDDDQSSLIRLTPEILVDLSPLPGSSSLRSAPYYLLDFASILPPLALSPQPGQRVLDLCAAPGGKTLVLAYQMFCSESSPNANHTASLLVANEMSASRRTRLRKVLDEYFSISIRPSEQCVQVTGHDGRSWGKGLNAPLWTKEPFDCILLDAPCSSERHFLQPSCQERWTTGRIKKDVALQLSLLKNTFRMLKPLGTLVYATCSLVQEENDGVLEKFQRKNPLQIDPPEVLIEYYTSLMKEHPRLQAIISQIECTRFGLMLLPDKSSYGPLYWAVLRKPEHLPEKESEESDDEEEAFCITEDE